MNSERLLNSIGNIDDKLIENAVKEKQHKKSTKLWRGWRMMLAGLACFIFLFFGVFGTVFAYNNAIVGNITVDVNPSIELSIARNGKVKDVEYLNEDAKKAFENVNLCKDNVETFVKEAIEHYKKLGYVFGDKNTILVSYDEKIGKNDKLKNQIEQSISTALKDTYSGELFIHQNSESEEAKSFAQEHNISVGKADWILSTANKIGQAPEELASLSVEELGQWQDEKPVPFGTLFIGMTKAKQIALKDAGVSSKVEFITEKLVNNGIKTPYYLLEFGAKSNYWKYRIDATEGHILEKEHTGGEVEQFITIERARAIALLDSGITESVKVVFTEEYLSRNNGRPCYVLSFHTCDEKNHYFHYKIDANDGTILESRFIGLEKAKQIALEDAGLTTKVEFIKTLLIDDGIKTPYYLLEFENTQAKWSYYIDATNGDIQKKDKKELNAVLMLTMEQAKQIAIQDTDLPDKVNMVFTKEELLRNNGKPYYALTFNTKDNTYFYYYEIDAYTGDILATRYIGMDKAKQIVLTDANASGRVVFINASLTDDGIKTPYYTIEFKSEAYQYFYKLDATNGAILKSEKNKIIKV